MRKSICITLAMALIGAFLVLPALVSAQTTQAKFSVLGDWARIYSRYYSGNVVAGILKMEVPPGNTNSPSPYDSYCIDLFTPISFGDIQLVNGGLSEAQLGDIDWCAVNYILNNYDYTNDTYTGDHPLAGLNIGPRAATIQAAIWYYVTAPYGGYNSGVSGVKYQFMTDPTNTTNFDAKPYRDRALAIVNSVPLSCDEAFSYPTSVALTPEIEKACGETELTATVYDQNDVPLSDITVEFTTDYGTLNPASGVTDGSGEVTTTLTLQTGTATVQAYATGDYGTLLYDPANTQQALTTLTLLPNSIGDTSTVICQPQPAIDVEKYVSDSSDGPWHDADTEPGLLVPGNDGQVYFKFVVTNTGNVDLTNVTLSDSVYPLSCTIPDTFNAGEFFECVIGPFDAEPGENGPNKNTATASGDYDEETVRDTDDAFYTPTYTKSGTVYYDDNGNGFQDEGELGIPYVTVYLCLGCPAEEAAPCNTLAITVTDSQGYYEFADVPACSAYSPDFCYVVSIPQETEDETDFNENLYSFFDAVEIGKVHYDDVNGRACIRFNLLADEPYNDFGYIQQPGQGVKLFSDAGSLSWDYQVDFNILHSNVYGLYSGPQVWWEITYYFANTPAYLGDMYDGQPHYFTLWDKWGGNLMALGAQPNAFHAPTREVTLADNDNTSFVINYAGYAEYLGEDGLDISANASTGSATINLHTGDQQGGTNPGKKGKGTKDKSKSYDANVVWDIGVVEPGERATLTIYVAPGQNPGGILQFSSAECEFINTGPVYRAWEIKGQDSQGKFEWAIDNKFRLSVCAYED